MYSAHQSYTFEGPAGCRRRRATWWAAEFRSVTGCTNGRKKRRSRMTNSLEDPIQSGPAYRITEVDGRNPGRLDDFAGENTFTIIKDGVPHSVFGTGTPMIDSIRFYQKDSTP